MPGSSKSGCSGKKIEVGVKDEEQERRGSALPGEECNPSVPDKKGRADLEISQHLSAQWTNLPWWSKCEIRLQTEHQQLPQVRMSLHKGQGQRPDFNAALKQDSMGECGQGFE